MDDQDLERTSNRWAGPERWTGPDKWQVLIGVLSLLVAIVACVGQFAR
ncbi:hypothetical protein [Streptomyces sp. NPDC047108]